MTHSKYINLLVNHHLFQTSPVKNETYMFYVASIITFSIFSELLGNPDLNSYVKS